MRGLLLSSLARGLLLLRELTVQSLLDDSRTDLEVVHPPLVEDVERLEILHLRLTQADQRPVLLGSLLPACTCGANPICHIVSTRYAVTNAI